VLLPGSQRSEPRGLLRRVRACGVDPLLLLQLPRLVLLHPLCWVPKNKHNPAPVVHYVAHNPQHQGPQVAGASGEAYNQDGHVQQQQPVGGYAPPPLVYGKTVPSEF